MASDMKNSAHSRLKISLVVTFFNEAPLLPEFLNCINKQKLKPDELILIDGGSSDGSMTLIKKYQKQLSLSTIVKIKKGNISTGRNYGVSLAKNNLIAFTDLGCLPDSNWLYELVQTYIQTNCPVVAGYYYGLSQNNLQQAMLPYSLVMPHQLKSDNFLPASRSMLIDKKLFQQLHGFDENLAVSEDYDLAKRIAKLSLKLNQKLVAFNPQAVVGWYPRKNLLDFGYMIYQQTKYDLRAGHIRPKVILILLRYVLAVLAALVLIAETNITIVLFFLIISLLIYTTWSVVKNIKSAKSSWYFLPLLQIISDIMVLTALLNEGPDLIRRGRSQTVA